VAGFVGLFGFVSVVVCVVGCGVVFVGVVSVYVLFWQPF